MVMIKLRLQRVWLGQAAAPVSKVVELTDAQWSQVTAAPKAVVKFYSPGCPYSKAFAPIYEALSLQYPDVLFAAINVDQSVQQAGANKVQMLPTVVFFVNGKAVNRIDGVQDQGDFLAEMNKAFSGGGAAPAAAPASAVGTAAAPRAGTLVETAPTVSPFIYVGGGAAAVALLGTAAYFLFRGK
jgi:thioredoxin 1